MDMPLAIKPFSPAPLSKRFGTPYSLESEPLRRRLEPDLTSTAPRPVMAQLTKPFDPLLATIYTPTGRHEASEIFLNCCRLIVHHSGAKAMSEAISGTPIAYDALLFVREPCRLFRHEILLPLQSVRDSSAYLPPFQSFMEHLLRQARVDLTTVFDPNFFTGEFVNSLFSVQSWMVSAHLPPSSTPPKTFHVYRLINSLRQHARQPLQLPTNGLSLADAKHIGVFAYSLFAMLDLTDEFDDRKFRTSLFGKRLRAWCDLPDTPLVHGIWTQSPQQASYYWFMSFQSLLLIFQVWIKSLRYHTSKGFFEACDTTGVRQLLVTGQTPSPIPDRSDSLLSALQQYDMTFAARWYQISPHDAIWSATPPPGHLPTPAPYKRQAPNAEPYIHPVKQARMQPHQHQSDAGQQRNRPDFYNNSPLLETTRPLDPNVPVSSQLFACLPPGVTYPKFPCVPSGTSLTTICFRSAFASPQNCCTTRQCKERRAPRNQRLHIDLGADPWRSKPESYWAPLVNFLLDPSVSPHLRPSGALKLATPNTNWA
jgi:hypothetical protein